MKKNRMRIMVFILLTLSVSPAWADIQPWTTVGSTGTVDEADTGIVLLGNPVPGAVSMKSTATGTLNIRYNVVAVDGIFGGDSYAITARFLDDGDNGQVIIRLKRYSFSTGATTTMLTFDSNAFAASSAFQTQTVGSACYMYLDFYNYAYFMDVEIKKTAADANPALAAIKLIFSLC